MVLRVRPMGPCRIWVGLGRAMAVFNRQAVIARVLQSVVPGPHNRPALCSPSLMHHNNWVLLHRVDSVASHCQRILWFGKDPARPNSRQMPVLLIDTH